MSADAPRAVSLRLTCAGSPRPGARCPGASPRFHVQRPDRSRCEERSLAPGRATRSLEGLSGRGERTRRGRPRGRRRRAVRDRRPLRLGQEHAPALDRGARDPRSGEYLDRRGAGRSIAAARSRRRDGVSEPRALSPPERLRQPRLRAPRAALPKGTRSRRESPRSPNAWG